MIAKRARGDAHTSLASGGINAALGTVDPEDSWEQHFADTLREGYFLVPGVRGAVTRDLFKAVQKVGGTTLLDTGWDPGDWQQETRSEIVDILSFTDVFLPNESEACALTDEREPETAALALHRLSGGAVVVKLGSRGALAITPRGDLVRVSAPMVESGDTTGAGDAFNAGLMNALEAGLDWHDALSTATVVASTVVGNPSWARFQLPGSLLSAGGPTRDHG